MPPQPNFEVPRFEPYFLQWDSIIFQPYGSNESYPMYVHKKCGGAYQTMGDVIPKRICPTCGVDTSTEPVPTGIILP